jgi:hypothetical protein
MARTKQTARKSTAGTDDMDGKAPPKEMTVTEQIQKFSLATFSHPVEEEAKKRARKEVEERARKQARADTLSLANSLSLDDTPEQILFRLNRLMRCTEVTFETLEVLVSEGVGKTLSQLRKHTNTKVKKQASKLARQWKRQWRAVAIAKGYDC